MEDGKDMVKLQNGLNTKLINKIIFIINYFNSKKLFIFEPKIFKIVFFFKIKLIKFI
mgnify:CR=1 FL=1